MTAPGTASAVRVRGHDAGDRDDVLRQCGLADGKSEKSDQDLKHSYSSVLMSGHTHQ